MNFSIKKLPKSEAEIEVTIPFAEFEPTVKRAAILISEKIEIEGFRRGKAPYEVVKNKIGESAIYEEAADLTVRKNYLEIMRALAEEGKMDTAHPPIGKPEITVMKLAPGNDLVFKIKMALLPEVALPDYKKIAAGACAKKEEATINDTEVDKAVDWLREARATLITVSRKAQKGDRVEVDFSIRHGGVNIENGESKNHPLIIGEARFLPGFEDELTGLEAGEKKEFSLTAPDNWQNKQWAGKKFDVEAEMKLVQERKVPELTDEFAKGLGSFESADALRQNIREGLAAEKKEKETQRIRALIMEEITAQSTAEIPEVLIAGELEKMLAEMKSGVEQMGMVWEDYLAHIKKAPDDLQKDWRSEAEKRVRIALCLREIARLEHIEPSEEEIAERAGKILQQYQSPDNAAKQIDPQELKEYARGILKNEKVFEFLENKE